MVKKLIFTILAGLSIDTAHATLIIDGKTLQKNFLDIKLQAEEAKAADKKRLLAKGPFAQFFEFWIKDIINKYSKKPEKTEVTNASKTHTYHLEIDLKNEKIAAYTQRKKIDEEIHDTIVISIGSLRKLTVQELFLLFAHEIGHLVLHHVSDTITHEHDSQQQELEADAFAAKLFPDKKALEGFLEKMLADHLPTQHERDVYDLFATLSLGTHPHYRQRYQAMKKIMDEAVHGKQPAKIVEISQ